MGLRFRQLGLGVVGLALAACLGDPVGPSGGAVLQPLAASLDSTLIGAPGRLLSEPLSWRLVDDHGRPVPGSQLRWSVVKGGGSLVGTDSIVPESGVFRTGWILGKHAADSQVVHVSAFVEGKQVAQAEIGATAVPVEVVTLRMLPDTLDVHLGVPLALAAIATDSFGNTFVPRGLAFTSLDTTGARVDTNGTVSLRRRGYVSVQAKASGVTSTGWVHGVQTVQSISVNQDTLLFHSLTQTLLLGVTLIDDHGLPVVDSLPVVALGDTSVISARWDTALAVQSVANGVSTVHLSTATVSRDVMAMVQQRTAHITFARQNIGFDALKDTVRVTWRAVDSAGVVVARPRITLATSDTGVARVDSTGVVSGLANGTATLIAKTPLGVSAQVPVVVQQVVAAVTVPKDTLKFNALKATWALGAVPRDRLGSPVVGAKVMYSTSDTAVATVDTTGSVQARANGAANLIAVSDVDTASIAVQVSQKPVRVVAANDTIRFDALGEAQGISATAFDSLGSAVPGGLTGLHAVDSAVAMIAGADTVRPVANGATLLTFAVAGLPAQVSIVVNQVPTKITVSAPDRVLTVTPGALLPLTCQALDKNGFAIPRDLVLQGSQHGTTTGHGCSDAQAVTSGYDTLSFSLGTQQAKIGVIVSTMPDTVSVLATAQPLTTIARDSFVGENLANPLILALRPLVTQIFAAYGNPTTNLDRARALRDWIARTAVHPHPLLHPDTSTANLGVLPPGSTWADVNAIILHQSSTDSMVDSTSAYWQAVGYDGYAMLNRLLGTLDPSTGVRADDGMMEYVSGVQYRIKNVKTYHYPICTFQAIMLNALLGAAGLQGMLISTIDHDPDAVFIPELGRWVYEDPTFNEEYLLDGQGDPMSPADLLAYTTVGQGARLVPVKLVAPSYDPKVYIKSWSYVSEHPQGFLVMGSQLNSRVVGIGGWHTRLVQIDVPQLASEPPFNNTNSYVRVTPAVAFPTLGVVLQNLHSQDSVFTIQLWSTFPNHDHFERRLQGGSWQVVTGSDVLPVGACQVEYRSVDQLGNSSAIAALDLWVPRTPAFVESPLPGTIRGQAPFCIANGVAP